MISTRLILCPELETCEDCVGLESEYRGHLARHAEAALVALVGAMSYAEATASVGVDEVGHPAALGELARLHESQS